MNLSCKNQKDSTDLSGDLNDGATIALWATTPSGISEVSGIEISTMHPNVAWIHSDDGAAIVYAVGAGDDTILHQVRLQGVVLIDWEDLSLASSGNVSYIYVADTGNNNHDRSQVFIHRFEEPDARLQTSKESSAQALETMVISWPAGSGNPNVEALLVDEEGVLWLLSKDGKNDGFQIWSLPFRSDQAQIPQLVGVHDQSSGPEKVTSADYDSETGRLMICAAGQVSEVWETLSGPAIQLQTMPTAEFVPRSAGGRPADDQLEAIALVPNGYIHVGEKSDAIWYVTYDK